MRLKCLACESLARPVYACAAASSHLVDVELVERRLHQPVEIRTRLQGMVDAAEGRGYDAVLLAYGLCGQTTAGLAARSAPLVIPRAHDCITLYLGSRARYDQETAREPGTYWYAHDYLERNSGGTAALAMGAGTEADLQSLYEHYIQKYGRNKADKLMEVMDNWRSHYKRAVYLDTGLGDGSQVEAQARDESARRGWTYESLPANLSLVHRLLDGAWDEDFLVVPPGRSIGMSYDAGILTLQG